MSLPFSPDAFLSFLPACGCEGLYTWNSHEKIYGNLSDYIPNLLPLPIIIGQRVGQDFKCHLLQSSVQKAGFAIPKSFQTDAYPDSSGKTIKESP